MLHIYVYILDLHTLKEVSIREAARTNIECTIDWNHLRELLCRDSEGIPLMKRRTEILPVTKQRFQ